jgi:hypothetical protein
MRMNSLIPRGVPVIAADAAFVSGLITLDVLARLLPHAPNFTPIAASALFAGAVLRTRALAFIVPVCAMLLSDCVLGFYDWRIMAVSYATFATVPAMGLLARRSAGVVILFPLAIASSVVFFITSNFAVWVFSAMYAHDLAGLIKCYIAAVPFFQNTLTGDLFWTAMLFGALGFLRFAVTKQRRPIVAA